MCTSCINYTCLRTQNFAYFDYGSGAVINQIKPELKILKKKEADTRVCLKVLSLLFCLPEALRLIFHIPYSVKSKFICIKESNKKQKFLHN